MTKEFTEKYPNTTARVVKALIRAAQWLDENNNANRPEGENFQEANMLVPTMMLLQ